MVSSIIQNNSQLMIRKLLSIRFKYSFLQYRIECEFLELDSKGRLKGGL
jgi:hypothetical protein